jgi:hypothetical protein
MRKNLLYLLSLVTVLIVTPAWAIPTLQIGAPDTGDYADYQDALSTPFEEDTAITSGGIIFAAGAYKQNFLSAGSTPILMMLRFKEKTGQISDLTPRSIRPARFLWPLSLTAASALKVLF